MGPASLSEDEDEDEEDETGSLFSPRCVLSAILRQVLFAVLSSSADDESPEEDVDSVSEEASAPEDPVKSFVVVEPFDNPGNSFDATLSSSSSTIRIRGRFGCAR